MLVACAARRWLARNAAGVKRIRITDHAKASACTGLVCCLPALEEVDMVHMGSVLKHDLGCLLEALAWCPRLTVLGLFVEFKVHLDWPCPDAAVFAKLHSLTKLALAFGDGERFVMANVVSALTPLTALIELRLHMSYAQVVPAALGQFKGLRLLELSGSVLHAFEEGCLELPNLLSLVCECDFDQDAQMLPSITSLQCLTRIVFSVSMDMCSFYPQLVQLPRLQHLVFSSDVWDDMESATSGLFRLPADMSLLSSSLLHLEVCGLLDRFPLALTQLVALEYLDASENKFTKLPAAITALSRLTELRLGRYNSYRDPLQLHEKRCLDARALGDLAGFPALRKLSFNFCEIRLSHSMLGAVRHACLTSLCFCTAHPAPKCALMVLQLSQALRRMKRGSVLRCLSNGLAFTSIGDALDDAQVQAPCQKFMAALEACGL